MNYLTHTMSSISYLLSSFSHRYSVINVGSDAMTGYQSDAFGDDVLCEMLKDDAAFLINLYLSKQIDTIAYSPFPHTLWDDDTILARILDCADINKVSYTSLLASLTLARYPPDVENWSLTAFVQRFPEIFLYDEDVMPEGSAYTQGLKVSHLQCMFLKTITRFQLKHKRITIERLSDPPVANERTSRETSNAIRRVLFPDEDDTNQRIDHLDSSAAQIDPPTRLLRKRSISPTALATVELEEVVDSEAINGDVIVIKSRRKRIRQSTSTLKSSDNTTTETILPVPLTTEVAVTAKVARKPYRRLKSFPDTITTNSQSQLPMDPSATGENTPPINQLPPPASQFGAIVKPLPRRQLPKPVTKVFSRSRSVPPSERAVHASTDESPDRNTYHTVLFVVNQAVQERVKSLSVQRATQSSHSRLTLSPNDLNGIRFHQSPIYFAYPLKGIIQTVNLRNRIQLSITPPCSQPSQTDDIVHQSGVPVNTTPPASTPTPEKYVRSVESLSNAFRRYEAAILFIRKPSHLIELITTGNFRSLAEYSISNLSFQGNVANGCDLTSFYFYRNPIEYFIDLARYVIHWLRSTKKAMHVLVATRPPEFSPSLAQQLQKEFKELQEAIKVLDNMQCTLHPQHVDRDHVYLWMNASLAYIPDGGGSNGTTALPTANQCGAPFLVPPDVYMIFYNVFCEGRTFASLNASCLDLFLPYPPSKTTHQVGLLTIPKQLTGNVAKSPPQAIRITSVQAGQAVREVDTDAENKNPQPYSYQIQPDL